MVRKLATAYPSRYMNEPTPWEKEELEALNETRMLGESAGKMLISFECRTPFGTSGPYCFNQTTIQRWLAQAVEQCVNEEMTQMGSTDETVFQGAGTSEFRKRCYDRKKHHYSIGEWTEEWSVTQNHVHTCFFTLEMLPAVIRTLTRLSSMGCVPSGDVEIHLRPDVPDSEFPRFFVNLNTILNARTALISKALQLEEEMILMLDRNTVALCLNRSAFSIDILEAASCVLHQAAIQALAVKKARTKEAPAVNPKFELRSWLLRLGFIGETFAAARHTLLDYLDGDAAFYSKDQRQRVMMNRRASRMNA